MCVAKLAPHECAGKKQPAFSWGKCKSLRLNHQSGPGKKHNAYPG